MKNKLYYKWQDLEKDCELLANQVRKDQFKYEMIVAITRGGLFVSGLLSQFLEPCAIETISLNSYKGDKREKLTMFQGINKKLPCEKSTLICDDVIDTGGTMKVAKKLFPNSRIIVLHYKSKNKPIIKPDYFCQDTDRWIVYPWEVNEK